MFWRKPVLLPRSRLSLISAAATECSFPAWPRNSRVGMCSVSRKRITACAKQGGARKTWKTPALFTAKLPRFCLLCLRRPSRASICSSATRGRSGDMPSDAWCKMILFRCLDRGWQRRASFSSLRIPRNTPCGRKKSSGQAAGNSLGGISRGIGRRRNSSNDSCRLGFQSGDSKPSGDARDTASGRGVRVNSAPGG